MTGVQTCALPIYIGKILEEIKGRPVYFVAEHDVKLADDAQHDAPPAAQPAVQSTVPGARTAAE